MSNYRDPKVTTPDKKSSMGKMIGIALAVILGLIVLAWALGTFDEPETETVPVVTEEPAATTGTAPAADPVTVPPAN